MNVRAHRASWWSVMVAVVLGCCRAEPAAAQSLPPQASVSAAHRPESHWAYQAPRRPLFPAVSSQLAREPIDLFILAELVRQNLQPSVEADRPTLLRRA